jgi:hypothetical protein
MEARRDSKSLRRGERRARAIFRGERAAMPPRARNDRRESMSVLDSWAEEWFDGLLNGGD